MARFVRTSRRKLYRTLDACKEKGERKEREREAETEERVRVGVTQLVFIATKLGIYQCERH